MSAGTIAVKRSADKSVKPHFSVKKAASTTTDTDNTGWTIHFNAWLTSTGGTPLFRE